MARKQQEIPGTEPARHPELDDAAEALREAQEAYKAAKQAVDDAHETLVQRMLNLKVAVYKYVDDAGDEQVARVTIPEPKATVKPTGEHDDEIGQGVESVGDRVDAADAALDRFIDAIPGGTTMTVSVGGKKAAKIEKRRVPRTGEHDAAADPFAATRSMLAEAK